MFFIYTYFFYFFFFFNDTATTEIYTLSLHDALPICPAARRAAPRGDLDQAPAGRDPGGPSLPPGGPGDGSPAPGGRAPGGPGRPAVFGPNRERHPGLVVRGSGRGGRAAGRRSGPTRATDPPPRRHGQGGPGAQAAEAGSAGPVEGAGRRLLRRPRRPGDAGPGPASPEGDRVEQAGLARQRLRER